MKKLKTILFSFVVLLSISYSNPVVKENPGLSFYVFGDWGRNGYCNQKEVAKSMGVFADSLDIDFIVSCGDNFQINGVRSTSDPLWNTSFESIYDHSSLLIDWYAVLGNHDYRGNPDAEIEYTKVSRRWNMPARYYVIHKEIENCPMGLDLIFIDTPPFQHKYYSDISYKDGVKGQDTTLQRNWLDSVLTASRSRWKIVIGHHPVFSSGKHAKDLSEMAKQFGDLFEKKGVDAYFSGHDHHFEHLKKANVNYFIVGTGSELRKVDDKKNPNTLFSKSASGITIVSLSQNNLTVKFIDTMRKEHYSIAIQKP